MDAFTPVEALEGTAPRDAQGPEVGIALCLSGGGYRAMLFHLGSLWRLNELGILSQLRRISSVSGGSITAGVLALRWKELGLEREVSASAADFKRLMVSPIRALANRTIDVGAVISGVLGPGNVGDRITRAYNQHLFHSATLQDLPDEPRFVFNATNVQSGALWRFMKPYMADYKVGIVENPSIPLALAVAASSAFPPFLSPVVLPLKPSQFKPGEGSLGEGDQGDKYRSTVVLTDGGVYDNLGLEPVWKNYQTVLVSDGGGQIAPNPHPKKNWISHTADALSWTDNQVRSLREQQVVDSLKIGDPTRGGRTGAFWGIHTDIARYQLADALHCPHTNTLKLALTPTRLKRLNPTHQEQLINWGYAVCDAALRRYFAAQLAQPVHPRTFPYPNAGV